MCRQKRLRESLTKPLFVKRMSPEARHIRRMFIAIGWLRLTALVSSTAAALSTTTALTALFLISATNRSDPGLFFERRKHRGHRAAN
jgi:hypothetical protein